MMCLPSMAHMVWEKFCLDANFSMMSHHSSSALAVLKTTSPYEDGLSEFNNEHPNSVDRDSEGVGYVTETVAGCKESQHHGQLGP